MQLPIYQSEEEQRLMVELWSPALADDPEAFVLFAFPWGQKNTPLHKFKGPRKWQREVLRDIKAHIDGNKGKIQMDTLREAVSQRPRDWQVCFGQLAGAVDADHPHRRQRHHQRQLGEPVALSDLGRADQVVGHGDQQPLV
jgi:hypothetical protein